MVSLFGKDCFDFRRKCIESGLFSSNLLLVALTESFKFSLNLLLPGSILLVEEVNLTLEVAFNLSIFAFLIFVTLLECLDLILEVLGFSLYRVSLSSQVL